VRNVTKNRHLPKGLACVSITTLINMAALGALSYFSQLEPRQMLRSANNSIGFLCSGSMTATSTILALTFTVLSFSRRIDASLKSDHYERMKLMSLLNICTFATALLLLLISVPLGPSVRVPENTVLALLLVLFFMASLLGGMLTTIIFLLYVAAMNIVALVHPEEDAQHLIRLGKEKDSEKSE
jgi:hypothetical protein